MLNRNQLRCHPFGEQTAKNGYYFDIGYYLNRLQRIKVKLTYIEDENNFDIKSDKYEEFWSFVFKATKVIGNPPIYVTEDEYFMKNHHNFPNEILVDGIRIN